MEITKNPADVNACDTPDELSAADKDNSAAGSPYLASYYEGIYYCNTDGSAYINNLGIGGITFQKVYASNGYKVHATVTNGYIGPNSSSATGGYGCYVELSAGSYTYLSGDSWLNSNTLGATDIKGYVNLHNAGGRDQYAVIDIIDKYGVIKQTFTQQVDRDKK